MNVWKEQRLGDFITLKYGKGLPERNRILGSYPVFGSGGIIGYHNQFLIKGHGIIVGRKGSIGTVYYSKRDFFPIDTVFYIELLDGYDIKFVYYLLKGMGLEKLNSDSAVPGLNRDVAHRQLCKTPSFLIQQKIASILSAYDDLIENNTRRIQILEEMARRIYEEWFVRFRFPGHKHVKMVESELGFIPEGWEVVALQTLYETASGGTPSRKNHAFYNGHINWVKTQELNGGFIFETNEKITEEGLKNSSTKLFQKETVLVAMYGATIGALGILDSPSTTNQACCAIIPSKKFFGFEYAFLTFLARRTELIELRTGAAQQNINQITVKNFKMLKPNLTTLSLFNRITNSILKQVCFLQKKNNTLRKTRDLLLPKLISGEIDVSGFPEPKDLRKAQGKAHESK